MATNRKKVAQKLHTIDALLDDHVAWAPTGKYVEQAARLLRALRELEALQEPFAQVDADVPFAVRRQRLLAWLATHPEYKNAGVEPVDDLPEERGRRGLRATAALAAGAEALSVPSDASLSTETAACSIELGPLSDDERLQLGQRPVFLLVFHLMVEHAKALKAGGGDEAGSGPVPPVVSRGQAAAARTAWEVEHLGAALPEPHDEEACEDDGKHGHSHGKGGGGGGHGHSHGKGGAAAGGGHGHSHGPGGNCSGHGGDEGGEPPKPYTHTRLTPGGHPWGSQFRAYISLLPPPGQIRTSLYFTPAEYAALGGTHASHSVATFLRDAVKNYLAFYPVFGTPLDAHGGAATEADDDRQVLVAGFQKYYTWAHFKWAMSVAMSRQNQTPGGDVTEAALPEAPPGGGFEPYTQWPAGVRRYGRDRHFNLALIPLFDMANHATGPLTSFFRGTQSLIEAGRAFAPGDEFTMSYGHRKSDATMQFQGFVDAANEEDTAAVEVALPALTADGGASPSASTVDPLLPIRTSLLSSLTVTPEHNAQRHLRSPAVAVAMRKAQVMADPREARATWDRVRWCLPFVFAVHASGGVSHDLLTFLRVGAIRTKAEAAAALKLADASRKAAEAAVAEGKARAQAARAARRAAAAKAEGAAGGDDEDDDDDGAEEDDIEVPPLALDVVSPEVEHRALSALVDALAKAVGAVEAGYKPPSPAASAAAVGADDDDDEVGGRVRPNSPVLAYRALQLRYLQAALAKARAAAAEVGKTVAPAAGGLK